MERIHKPFSRPLIDINPKTAHKKLYWASSLQKIQEDMLANKEYSVVKPPARKKDADDLVILNIYITAGINPGWGLGPSPLSPLYLHYPALHPADFNLSKAPHNPASSISQLLRVVSNINNNLQPQAAGARPCMLQYFLDRRDFSTRANITTTCVRFNEDYVEWRLTNGPGKNTGDNNAPMYDSLRHRLGLKPCPYSAGRILWHETLAARIHIGPIVTTVNPDPADPIMNLYSSGPNRDVNTPIYINKNEVDGEPGIALYYQRSRDRIRRYWWVWEGSSWVCEYNPHGRTEWRSSWNSSEENAVRRRWEQENAEVQGYASAGVSDERFHINKLKYNELECPIVNIYHSSHDEPLAAIELGAGQMWIQKTTVLDTIDIIVSVAFAVVNMERAIRDERALKAAKATNFFKKHFSS